MFLACVASPPSVSSLVVITFLMPAHARTGRSHGPQPRRQRDRHLDCADARRQRSTSFRYGARPSVRDGTGSPTLYAGGVTKREWRNLADAPDLGACPSCPVRVKGNATGSTPTSADGRFVRCQWKLSPSNWRPVPSHTLAPRMVHDSPLKRPML